MNFRQITLYSMLNKIFINVYNSNKSLKMKFKKNKKWTKYEKYNKG